MQSILWEDLEKSEAPQSSALPQRRGGQANGVAVGLHLLRRGHIAAGGAGELHQDRRGVEGQGSLSHDHTNRPTNVSLKIHLLPRWVLMVDRLFTLKSWNGKKFVVHFRIQFCLTSVEHFQTLLDQSMSCHHDWDALTFSSSPVLMKFSSSSCCTVTSPQ